MTTRLLLLLALAAGGCGRSDLVNERSRDGLGQLVEPDGGSSEGDCLRGWDVSVVSAKDERGAVAYLPVCGKTTCLPIVTSGHPAPSYAAPRSTCDELPASVRAACGTPPTCDCLAPLLRQGEAWPFTRWNCSWICSPNDDGTARLLWCSLP